MTINDQLRSLITQKAPTLVLKQKTAYEMLRSLVGSEMCIRDSSIAAKVDQLSSLFAPAPCT